MDEILTAILGFVLRAILFIAVEGMFYQLFYYIGAVPIWIISGGRLPTRAIHKLSRTNRRLYGAIGLITTIGLGVFYISLAS